jgi:hypothetical protein
MENKMDLTWLGQCMETVFKMSRGLFHLDTADQARILNLLFPLLAGNL